LRIKPVPPAGDRSRKLVSCHRGRIRIDVLTPGERALHLETSAHLFLESYLQCFIIRISFVKGARDLAESRVDLCTSSLQWEEITVSRTRRNHHIGVIHSERLVYAAG